MNGAPLVWKIARCVMHKERIPCIDARLRKVCDVPGIAEHTEIILTRIEKFEVECFKSHREGT